MHMPGHLAVRKDDSAIFTLDRNEVCGDFCDGNNQDVALAVDFNGH